MPYGIVIFEEWSSFAEGSDKGRQIYFDDQGRLRFCRATLHQLIDEGVEGAIALAFAVRKVTMHKVRQRVIEFCATLAGTILLACAADSYFLKKPESGSLYERLFDSNIKPQGILALMGALTVPAWCVLLARSRGLQGKIDNNAVTLTDHKNIVAAIKELAAIAAVQREEQRIHTIEELRAAI